MITFKKAVDDADGFSIFLDERDINCLFTNGRIDRTTVPEGYFVYDLREGDDGQPCTIENNVTVNHFGCIITKEDIRCPENGYELESDDVIYDDEGNVVDFVPRKAGVAWTFDDNAILSFREFEEIEKIIKEGEFDI